DSETGLHYNRYRYYEPYSARYVSKDPIGLFGGLNTSAYVINPNQWVDPLGLMAVYSWEDENGSTKFTSSQNEAFNAQKKGFQVNGLDNASNRNLNKSREKQAEKAKLEQFKRDDAKKRKMTANPNYIPSACTMGSQYACGQESQQLRNINEPYELDTIETEILRKQVIGSSAKQMAKDIETVGNYAADQVPAKKIYDGLVACQDGKFKECASLHPKVGDGLDVINNTEKTYDILKEIVK
ncbi:MAG: RHS repeat-associated core domain-containing protein, partial [Acinetobacter sp.]